MKIITQFILALLLLAINELSAQITLQFNTINEYAFNSREALNFTAINSGAKSFEIEFRGKISLGDGQTVVEFKTNPLMINPGANMVSPMSISFRELLYYNNDIAEIESKTGTYPSGNYTICIWSACIVADCNGAGQTAGSLEAPVCTKVHVENPTPLLLAFPENEAEIEETRPLYTWIPPAPVAGSASLNYTMTLVEVLEGQSKADALSLNRSLIDMQDIGNPMLMHPSDLPALEAGRTYAWQVEAYVGKTSIAKSEQWKFKVKKEEKAIFRYFDLNNLTSDIPKVKLGDKLFFTIQNQLSITQPQFLLKELNGNSIIFNLERVVKDSLDVKQDVYTSELSSSGISKYLLTLNSIQFVVNKIYELSIQYNNQKTIFRFEIIE